MEPANLIIRALEKGSIPTVIMYGDTDTMPPPPYVVLKPEVGALPSTRQFRIIVHYVKGRLDELEGYALHEVDELLPGLVTDDDGNRYKLYKSGYTDVTADPQDDSYFMERIFSIPMPGIY